MLRPHGVSGWASTAAAAFMVVAAVLCVAAIPAVFQDPDASVIGASGSLLMVAVVNAGMAFAVIASQRVRVGLILIALFTAGLSLFALDGAASMSTHANAPAVLPLLFWGVVGADGVAVVATIVAAIASPRARRPASA